MSIGKNGLKELIKFLFHANDTENKGYLIKQEVHILAKYLHNK